MSFNLGTGYHDKDWNFVKEPTLELFIDGISDNEHSVSLKELAEALKPLLKENVDDE